MYRSISAKEVKTLIGRVNILDIRANYLYRLSSIPSSKNIPVNYLLMDPDKYLNKSDEYYIYCSFGMQSAKACYELDKKGYKVVNVLGGYNDYLSKY